MALAGKNVLVTGTTGNVGWGIAKAALAAGARVIAPVRSDKGAAETRLTGDVSFVVGDLSDPEDAARVARACVEARGPLDHVVVSLGPWWQKGPIVEQTPAEHRAVMRAMLDGHVFTAMALLPDLRARAGTSYTLVTGAAGERAIPGAGLLVIGVAGVMALSRTLRAEHADDAVRVNELLIDRRIEREPRAGVVPAEELGAALVSLLESDVRGKVLRFVDAEAFRAAVRDA